MLIGSSTPRSPAGGRCEEAGAPPTRRCSVCSQEKPADTFLQSRFDANEIRRVHAEGMGQRSPPGRSGVRQPLSTGHWRDPKMKLKLRDGNRVMGDIVIDKDEPTFGHSNAWLVVVIFVEPGYPAKKVRQQLYDWAERIALDAGRRLVPSPDMIEGEFEFWRETDPEALLKVFSHVDAKHYVDEQGGDLDDFQDRFEMIWSAFKKAN